MEPTEVANALATSFALRGDEQGKASGPQTQVVRAWTKKGLQRMAARISLSRARVLCRTGVAFCRRASRIRCVPDPEGRHERGEEAEDDEPQVVIDRVLRIVLDVAREVGRGIGRVERR